MGNEQRSCCWRQRRLEKKKARPVEPIGFPRVARAVSPSNKPVAWQRRTRSWYPGAPRPGRPPRAATAIAGLRHGRPQCLRRLLDAPAHPLPRPVPLRHRQLGKSKASCMPTCLAGGMDGRMGRAALTLPSKPGRQAGRNSLTPVDIPLHSS